MSIQPLPGDVVAQIKSSAVITSLNGVVCGLLQNSLDAGASKINISVDYSRGNCSVEDNGHGIAPAAFQEDGALGKLHCTSKYPPRPDCHGRHGEFLASLAALSLLSVTSHHRDYRSHNSLIIHNSRVLVRNIPAPPEQRVLAFTNGTRVLVRDLFGSMPVRVKQRALEVERAGTSKDFELLISSIVALLLSWPGQVTVALQDSYARRTVSLSTSRAVDWGQSYRTMAPGIVSKTTTLLTQAFLLDHADSTSWVPIGATASGISVRGCVSIQPVATKRVQFIALGIQPLVNEHQSNFLYEEVNRVFGDSSFGVVEEATIGEDGLPTKTAGFTGKELKPKKGVDRWPMFFLQIVLDIGADSVDIDDFLDERHQNLAVITDLLQVMVYEFLKKHHFRPRCVNALERLKRPKTQSPLPPSQPARATPGRSSGQITSKSRRPQSKRSGSGLGPLPHPKRHASEQRCTSPFASWSRLKSNTPSARGDKNETIPHRLAPSPLSEQRAEQVPTIPETETNANPQNPLFDRFGILVRKPFDDADEVSTAPVVDKATEQAEAETERETVVWIDPATKIRSLIDPRTGFAVRSRTNVKTESISRPISRKGIGHASRIRTFAAASGERHRIFQPTEAPVPQVLQASETLCCDHAGRNMEREALVLDGTGSGIPTTLEGRISKAALQDADIISQVDQKFILAKVTAALPATSTRQTAEVDLMLVLIDQHAADERCKVERLLSGYFISDPAGSGDLVAQTQRLDKPIRFELSGQDGDLLSRFSRHFASWGITYDVSRQEQAPTHKGVTVEVQGLPPSILERCRLDPRILIDLLRKEIWKLHSTGSIPPNLRVGPDWVTRFQGCPQGILDLINSRACRSAIMFNDVLTQEHCRDLVQRLASCAFPFQCAHGRPSMVPLVHLGQNSMLGARDAETDGGEAGELASALRKWKRSFRG